MANERSFFVVGPDNLTSWNDTAEAGEAFRTVEKALARATELAEDDPGQEYLVCQAVRVVSCPVGKPIVSSA